MARLPWIIRTRCSNKSNKRTKSTKISSLFPKRGNRNTKRTKAVVPVLVLLFVALWFILRGDLFYVLPCVVLFLCFSVILTLRLPRLGKKELILRLFDLRLFDFVGFLFLLVSGKGCGFVIVALPGLFSYLFLRLSIKKNLHYVWLC